MTDSTVDAWLSRIGPPYPDRVDVDLLRAADEAVAAHPASAALWIARGDLIQLGGGNSPEIERRWPFAESMRSYTRAVEAEPESAAGYEELGIWLEIHDEDRWDEAAGLLDEAIARGAGPYAFVSRARLHAAFGELSKALELLSPARCPFATKDDVVATRREIEDGDWG